MFSLLEMFIVNYRYYTLQS